MADLDTYTQSFRRLQDQKSQMRTGGIEARVLTSLAFYFGEHSAFHTVGTLRIPERKNNEIRLVFNLIRRRVNKLLGRFMSINGQFRASPNKRESTAIAKAEVASKMIKALDQKLDQMQRSWEIWWWMLLGGVAFEHVPWIPDDTIEPTPKVDGDEFVYRHLPTEQEVPESVMKAMVAQGMPEDAFEIAEEAKPVGDVGSIVYGPLNIFVDHSVRDLQKLPPDQWIFIAEAKSVDWITTQKAFSNTEAVQPMREINIVKSNILQEGDSLSNMNLRDLLPVISGEVGEDSNVAVFVQGYAAPSAQNPRGKYVCFVPDQAVLLETDLPYTDLEIPIIDYHWAPITTNFWTEDYVTDLIVPNKFINKRFSQLAEYANAFLQAPRLLGPSLTKDDIPSDFPGYVENGINEQGQPMVAHAQPPAVGSWFMKTIDDILKMLNELAGGADLFQESKFPGQLRGPMVVPMLQELLDSEWGPLFLHVGQQMARAKKLRLNRVKQFYPPLRTLHYTGKHNRDEVLEFHTDEILRSNVEYNITVDASTLMPEFKAMREARVKERIMSPLAILYMDKRTGKIDPSKVAADLHWAEDEGREEREAQYRKLAREFITRIKRGDTVTTVLPFWGHAEMMDEYEAEMATTEFLESSPQIQQALLGLYEKHRQYLAKMQEAMQNVMMDRQVQGAVAQATQQAAARAAAEATDAALDAVRAQLGQGVAEPTPPELLALMAAAGKERMG